MKHPTNTELLNPVKDTLPEEKNNNLTLQPSAGRNTFFPPIQTLTEAVYSQAARTQRAHYILKNPNCIIWATQYDPTRLHCRIM